MKGKKHLFSIAVICSCLVWHCTENKQARKEEWLTLYEQSGCVKTPRYNETVAYCRKLADASPWIRLTDFGVSARGRKLPLLIVDKDRQFNPQMPDTRNKAVVLIQACIHPGESDGKDAGLMLIRDIVIVKKYPEILDNITILFIPVFNVDGHERFGPYTEPRP
jgi:murein tripeptide amidase MpaA